MIDLLGQVVNYLRLDNGASGVQALLGSNPADCVTTDFDPGNVPRPYVIALQSHWESKYKGLGNTMRVESQIISLLVFTDTRSECIALLDALEQSLILNATLGLGPPEVADKVAQWDLNKIDAYKGTLNLLYQIQQQQG